MADADHLVSDGLLRLLELLAMEAPPQRFDGLTEQARVAGASTEAVAVLDRAAGLALDIHGLFARRQQREAGLSALVDTARELTLPYDVDALLRVIARRARLLLGFDMAWVSLTDRADGRSYVVSADGHASSITVGFAVPSIGGVGNAAAIRSAPFWTPDYLADRRFEHDSAIDEVVREEGLHALMAVPLKEGHSVVGALYVADRGVRHFTPDEITLMSSLGDLAALAIKKARLLTQAHDEISELERDTSRALGSSSAARRLNRVHSRLIDLVLRGCELEELVAHAAAELGSPLMVRDAVGSTLTVTEGFPEVDESELFQRTLDVHAERAPIRSSGGLWLCPAIAGKEILGTLVLAPGPRPAADRVRLLEAVAQSTAVLLRMQASAAAAEGAGRDELLRELLGDSPRAPEQLALRARRLGVALDEPHVVLVVRPEGGPQGRVLVWASSYVHRHAGLKTTTDDCLVLVLPGTDPSTAARHASDTLNAVIGHPVTVGSAGPVAHPGAIHRTYAEARRCLDALTALGGTGGTASLRELGFLGLLLADTPDTSAFIAGTIGPVLEYDERQATELTRTLEAYFTSGGSPSRAAESLHVHPNTVSRRLERITDLLGPGWQEPLQAVEVQLALRLRRTRHTVRNHTGPPVLPHDELP
ncbi:GAF domain-containing protein [Streptomyces sp. CB02400]|uniref:helix-turn-helix domain-containing protein n=1 Tax=unclassified Streptomyces TaxID=2593676 RepID=UPI000B2C0145|nr:GAF domain-containing protein [Streptomyces sp. CB02400]